MDAKGRDAAPPPASAEAAAPPPSTEPPRRRAGGSKRKSSGSSSSAPSKRQAKERNPLHHPPPTHNGPWTRARQTPHKHAAAASPKTQEHASTGASATEFGGKDASADRGTIKAEEVETGEEQALDAEFQAVLSRGANVHAVPTPAGWFSWDAIHPLEKHMLPSFFNGKTEDRTPEVYLEIRDAIMRKFHADPQKQLELKDLPDIVVGNADAKQEVMEFLDHWGLINFHPFPPSAPPSKPNEDNCEAEEGDKTPSLVDKLYQFEMIVPFPNSDTKKEEPIVPMATPSLLPNAALADDLVKPVGPSVDYHCNSCSADCSRKRYHCQKQADFDLCTDCYNDGKFGSGMAPADFILMDSAEVPGVSGASWTDQETLLLLEALELFPENWNEVAEHVATKTKAQCILHFLQMPIEDSFLEGDGDDADNNQDNKDQTPNTNTSTPELMEAEKKESKEEPSATNALEVEAKRVESSDNVDQPVISQRDASMDNKNDNISNSHATAANFAIDALKAAFQAVGCFPEQEGLGSFAEAGNPVMALAAFLTGLAESDAVIASCISSLQSMSLESPGIQLATRHCFLLEDPPKKDWKDPPANVSITETSNNGSCKDDYKMTNLDGTDKPKDQNEIAASMNIDRNSSQGSSPKQIDANDTHDATVLKTMPTTIQDTVVPSSGEQCMTSNVEKATDAVLTVDPAPSTTKENEDLASQEEKNQEKESSVSMLAEEEPKGMKHSEDLVSKDIVNKHPDSSEAADKMNTSVVLEEQECHQTKRNTDNKAKADEGERKEVLSNDENSNPTGSSDGYRLNRLKRAAVTALSAAAVKAKLLAELEENEIQKLVSFIIEKQLYKLEAKLQFLTGIERIVMRMREETEKARQRLIHERSLIIAARLGVHAPSLKGNPGSVPSNRLAMGHGSVGSKPHSMAMQKPTPMRRP